MQKDCAYSCDILDDGSYRVAITIDGDYSKIVSYGETQDIAESNAKKIIAKIERLNSMRVDFN
ncbi:hypothetical protein [Psychrobacter sp. UBA2514]|jgi:hypothetical protein|uniref:hypothetical protein n=1 Tax=Psychrobacter sp. UBA2514 TaxID=1947346 RepID=UPI00257BD3BC|nr:hypothetical protein [Psychrobacter sp. UBA2514]|tara:strand:+ start:1390 stop:1578 length:189 start_codon:yes stop_codon:yes gene_type:complete